MNDAVASVRPWGRNTIVRAWRGQEPLWLVFWIYNVLIGHLLGLFTSWLEHSAWWYIALPLILFMLAYGVWGLVATWRCASNSTALWCFLARLIVIINVVWFVWGFVRAFV